MTISADWGTGPKDWPNGHLVTADDMNTYISNRLLFLYQASQHYIRIADVKPSGTTPGSSAAAAWQTRNLNTEQFDTANLAVVAANQITLKAGTYYAHILITMGRSGIQRGRLQNITAGSTLLLSSSMLPYSSDNSSPMLVTGRFTIAVDSVLEVQHYTTTAITAGLGAPTSIAGVDEVYTVAEFWRVS